MAERAMSACHPRQVDALQSSASRFDARLQRFLRPNRDAG